MVKVSEPLNTFRCWNVMEAAAPKSPAELVPSISKERDWFFPFVIKTLASSWVLSFWLISLKLILVYFSARSRPMEV